MNIIKKEYIYEINASNIEDLLSLNESYSGRGGGGASLPYTVCGFSFVALMETRETGVVFVTTYNEENFGVALALLFKLTFSPFGEPLKPIE